MQHCYEGLEKMDAMLKELSALGLVPQEIPLDAKADAP
jgi:hypothetical protein